MSYTRYTNRKNERASTKDAARMTRTEENQLTHKVLSALMAAGLVMSPTAVDASEIRDVNNQTVSAESGVYNIYAQKRHDDIAINEFEKFQLEAHHIANLYFRTQDDTINAGNLLNFVNTRIDINGTVNAIKNGTIGGNLFFLSPEGMAVGKSGVINTGALYVMAPATTSLPGESNYESLKGVFNTGAATEEHLNAIKNGSPLIPLNPSGTISVLGKINAADDVKLYAAQIAVGRNLTGEAIDGIAAGGIKKTAAIETGVTDFASLVNLSDDQKTAAGLGDLQATQTGNGDIVLAARAEYANAYDKAFNDLGKLAGLLGTTETPEINVPKTITASVENYGTIKTSTATGDVVLKAEATNGNKDHSASDASAFAQTVADVKVQGDVKAAGQVELTAKADNTYVDSGKSVTDKLGDTLSYVMPVGANVMILDNKASVTVEKEAQVEGSQVAISAEANLDGTAGVTAAGRKLVSKVPSAIPAVGMGYAKVTNEATVQIDGKVKATGADKGNVNKALQIKANAQSAVDHSASTTVKKSALGAGSASLAAAVAITDHKNDATVNLNGTAEAEQGSASVTADTAHKLNTSATAKAADETVGTAVVDVVVHASTSAVDVQGTVNAKNDVTIKATNTTDENTHVSNNNLGMGKLQAEAMKAADLTGISKKVKENKVVSSILSKLPKDGGNTDVPLSTTLGQTLSAGAAVTVADETNKAKVNIGSKASVQAGQKLTAKAESKVYDTMMTASGTTSSFKNSDNSSDTVTIATGVVYAGMDNQADVTVADGTDDQHATLQADGNLNLQSSNIMEYHRPERMKREIDRSIEKLDTAITAIENMPESKVGQGKEILEQLEKLKTSMTGMAAAFTTDYLQDTSNVKNLTAEGTLNKIGNVAGTGWEILNAVTKIQQSVGQLQDVTSPFGEVVTNALAVVTNAVAFTEPNQYANVSAAAVSRGGSDTKASLAAAVTATDFDYGSHVTVGKHASLTAGNALNLKAEEAVKDVNITGKNKIWKNDAEAAGGVGIGGSVNYQNFDTDTLVKVDKGAALTAGDMKLASSSDIFHTGVMLSAGKAEGSAISGMLAMTDSDSKNQTLVDKDAVLKAVKDAGKNHQGSIAITGYNDTNVNNAILSLSAGSGAAAAGIAVAINKVEVVNRAAVKNIDADDDDEKSGSIQASKLGVSAETTGLINTISVAGGVTASGKDPEKPEEDKGPLDKLGDGFGKLAGLTDTVNGKINDVSKKVQNVISTVNGAGASQGGTQSAVPTKSETAPSFAFAGAGSVSLNLVSDTTQAVIDGAHVNLNNDGVLQAGARDTAFVGAFSGGAAISARKGQSSGTSAAFSGAVGVNKIENTIESAVMNSTVEGLKSMDVTALSGGTSVAVGTGLSLTKNSQPGNNFAGGASVSVNLIDKDVKALAEKNTVSGVSADEKAAVKLTAYESDLQVTGGVNANVATGGGTAVGGSITVADIKNDLDARISGGTYTNIEKADAESLLATKQITAAISTGVAVGGNGKNNAFTGAMVYNGLHNAVNANISGGTNITADSIAVRAHDTTSGSAEAKPYQDLLGNYTEHQQFAEDAGVDTDGSSYYKTSDSSNGLDTAGETVDYDANKGSLSVGAAFVVAGSSGNAAGAAVNVANVDNDFTAALADATLAANSVSAEADADSLAVNVSAGVAAGSKDFGGMGSVTWQDMDNTVLAKASDSAITADSLAVKAASNSQAVNVAGSVAYGKTAGVGAALAYNGLDNHIGAYLAGGSVTAKTPSTGVSVDVEGKNTGKIYGIGAAVAASQTAAVNGTVVVNHGGSDTEAVVGEVRPEDGTNTVKDTAVANAKAVKVKAESDDVRVAAAGNISASGKVALGGAVAYNDVGGASTSTAKASQKTRAALNKTTLTHVTGGTTSVEALDGSKLTTAAVGVGGAGKVAVQGAAATSLVNKAVSAEVKDSSIDKDEDKAAVVSVQATSNSEINSTAVVGAGSGTFAGGAGVAVNRINQDTETAVSDSTLQGKSTTVQATGNSAITSVGVGAAASGQVAIAGNIAVNQIGNNVTAAVKDSKLTNTGNIAVMANGRENLGNYAGTLGLAAGGRAGLGMGVSYNAITGATTSQISGSTLTGKGQEADGIALTGSMDSDGVKASTDTRKGVVVASYGQHDLQSVALTTGAAASGDVAVGAAGTVTVNKIGGSTEAVMTKTTVNANHADGDADNVSVNAKDKTESESHVGSLSVGIGASAGGAGFSAASDTLVFDRATKAELSGSDTVKATVNGRTIDVKADQSSNVITNADGLAVSGGTYGAGSAAATAAATKLSGSTQALVKDIRSQNAGLSVQASHDHKTTLVSASAAVSAAIASGAIGAGIGVVNDDFHTTAELSGSTITAGNQDGLTDSGRVSVTADSASSVDTYVLGVADSVGGAGVTVAVNNLDSTASALVGSSDVKAADALTVDAHNNVTTDFQSIQTAGGGVAIATGIGINTIDTGTVAQVMKSTIEAKTAAINAREELDVDQTMVGATVGGMGLNANVMVTSIGTAAADTYGSSADNGASFNTARVLEKANTALDAQQSGTASSSDTVRETLHNKTTGIDVQDDSGIRAGNGTSTGKGTQVSVVGSRLTTSEELSLTADRQTDAEVTATSASLTGAFGISATVAVLDMDKKTGIAVDGSTLAAGTNLLAQARQHGETAIDAYQAGISGAAAVSAAYAQSSSSGSTAISLKNSTLKAAEAENGSIAIQAEDAGATRANVTGMTAAGFISGGALITKAENDSDTSITLDSTMLTGTGDVTVESSKSNTVSAKTLGGAAGALALQGVVAAAEDKGSSTIALTGKSALSGKDLALTAKSTPQVMADATAYSGALVGAGGASIATAKVGGKVQLTAAEGASFTGDDIAFTAFYGQQGDDNSSYKNAKATAVGNAAARGGTIQANVATAEQDTEVHVDLGKSKYTAENLTIAGNNAAALDATAKGVAIGGYFASGTNIANLTGNLTTNIAAKGAAEDSALGNVYISSSGYGELDGKADGAGGGLVTISPWAAKANSTLHTDTNTSISGGWKAASMKAASVNSDDVDVTADSLSASVIGASGTQLDTTVHHKAQTDVTGSVETSGSQDYTAANAVYHDVDLKGSGYGGISVNANIMTNDLSYTAKVNLNHATLKGTGEEGSITAEAVATGQMDYLNHLQSAGVIPVTVASSKNTIVYDNSINAADSTLTTDKTNQDITLAASDDTTGSFKTVANTQGGFAGTASSTTDNSFRRANTINISGGMLESTNDVNLYAGADAEGLRSVLNYNAIADAYNKTTLPLGIDPSVKNTMSQANQVNIDGMVRSVRHTNLKAGKGLTTVAESAREYNIYTGTSGKGTVTSTALGEHTSNETTENRVQVGTGGSVTAGIHTDLDISIDGKTKINTSDKDAGVDTSGIAIKVNKGSDWLSASSVAISNVTLYNSLKSRYNDLSKKAGEYSANSNEYKLIRAEMDELRSMMEANGFIKNNTVLDKVGVAAVALPDIVVSGGNIVIDADKVSGSGSLNAKGANQVNVVNNSDLYLKVGDVIIQDKGGEIRYNDSLVTSASELGGYGGKAVSSGANGVEPSITIKSTGMAQNEWIKPDIGVFGQVQNANGDVTIHNDNANIVVDSTAVVSGRNVTLSADKGSITQISDGWLLVGTDPITRYQFSDSIAQKIQTYISANQGQSGNTTWLTQQDSYEAYRKALLKGSGTILENKIRRSVFSYEDYTAAVAKGAEGLGFTSNLRFTPSELDTILNARQDSSAGIHAENNIYLYGKNVILDGLVQSGYDSYTTILNEAPVTTSKTVWSLQKTAWGSYMMVPKTGTKTYASREAMVDADWQAAGKPSLADSQVLGNVKYLVNDGGSRYNTDRGIWEYEVKVYYNPSTGNLLTENITSSGGKIYITGALASTTGNGRLVAMDGTPTISIDATQIDKNLVVGNIQNRDLDGLISIKDTNSNTLTEFRNTDGKVNASVISTGSGSDSNRVINNDDGTVSYRLVDQTLKWTGGTSGEKKVTGYRYDKDFLFWSLIKYNQTSDFVTNQEVANGKVETSSSTISGDKTLDAGKVIIKGTQNKEYQVSTDIYEDPNDVNYSDVDVDVDYDGFWGSVFGYGKVHYTWTKTQGQSTSSTYSIKAGKPIGVSFLQNGQDTITIKGQRNVSLSGNITSAGSGGTVTLTSQKGGIKAQNGASINTDSLTAKAQQDISLNHSAIGDTANISLTSDKGSVTLLSGDGNLNIKEASAKNGNLYLQADGNLQSAKGKVLTGNRIDLVSKRGAITADVAAATKPLDSDPMSASINAQAEGNITLQSSNGTMRVGHIISNSGDVNLTTNGNFEDAVGNGMLSGSSDKMALWKEMGLVSDADADDSRTAAATASKKERLDALTVQGTKLAAESGSNHALSDYEAEATAYAAYAAGSEELQAAKKAYETRVKALKGETSGMTENERQAAFDEAFKPYDEVRKAYFADKDYTGAEQEFILNYSEVKNSDAYGWSRNDLLYAIQASVLNAAPKDEVVTVDTPNIKGRNITLDAGKNIGVDDEARAISYDALTKVENLQLLSQAKAGDLTWQDDAVVVKQQKPLTVQLGGGRLTLNANKLNEENTGNIYIAGVKDTVLDVTGKIQTTENVKLMSDNGVKMTEGGITADNLIITGGKGDVGSDEHNIRTNLSGTLDARTAGDIYLHQTGLDGSAAKVLTIQNIAGNQVNIASDAGMVMTTEQGKTSGYINGNQVSLISLDGNIGAADDAIRVKNSGILNADARKGSIYIAGKEPGTLTLGQVKGKDEFILQSEGTVQAGSDAADSSVESNINAGKVGIESAASTLLKNGSLTADTLKLKAGGSVKQTAAHAITAPDVSVDAAAGISLNSGAEAESKMFNAFKEVTLNNASEVTDIVLGNGGDKDLTVTFANGSKAKDVIVRNYAHGKANDLDINGPIAAAAGIALINDEGSLATKGGLDAKADIRETAKGSLNNRDALHAEQDIVLTATDGSIINDAAITAKRNVTMKAGDSIENRAATTAYTGAISLNAYHDIKQKGDAKAGTDITAESADGSVTVEGSLTSGKATFAKATDGDVSIYGDVQSGTSFAAQADNGSVSVTGDITSGTSVAAQATEGNVTVGGSLTSKDGDTVLSASDSQKLEDKGNIRVTGSVDSAHDIEMTTDNGAIEVGGTTQAAQDIRAAAEKTGQIRFVGDAKAVVGRLQAKTDVGDISFEGKAASGTDLTAETTDGSISFEGQTTSGGDLSAATKRRGDITFAGLINAGRDAIANAAQSGTITLRRDVTANRDIKMHTHDGSMVFDGRDVGKAEDIRLTAVSGNVELRTTGTGDIKDSHSQENGDRAFVNATNGNVTIRHEGTGNVDLYGLYAKKEAATELKNGSLYLDTMDGDLVAMFVRNSDKVMDVKHITAGQEIAVAGADIGIDDILQREGAEGLLTITPTGASDDAPIKNLHIGDIRTNEGSGVRFKHLWLENGDVSVSKGQLLLDKLYVLDKARFSNGVMTTNVFGTAPVYEEGVTSAYWNDTAINDPKEALASWLNGAPDENRWMFLRFYGQVNAQHSNGNLLDLADHYRVNRERYTEADWMRMMKDKDRYDFYRMYYHPALSLHDRFGLVDASDYLGASKAKPGVTDVDEAEREKA